MNLNTIKYGIWVIAPGNEYYQYVNHSATTIVLSRFGGTKLIPNTEFAKFILASDKDVEQHLLYLKKTERSSLEMLDSDKFPILDYSNGFQDIVRETLLPSKHLSPVVDFDIHRCDFYMISVDGSVGSKVRHNSYKIAETEAIRLCGVTKEEVKILGVIAKIKPVVKFNYEVVKGQ